VAKAARQKAASTPFNEKAPEKDTRTWVCSENHSGTHTGKHHANRYKNLGTHNELLAHLRVLVVLLVGGEDDSVDDARLGASQGGAAVLLRVTTGTLPAESQYTRTAQSYIPNKKSEHDTHNVFKAPKQKPDLLRALFGTIFESPTAYRTRPR